MKALGRPDRWFLLAVLLMAIGGTVLLALPNCAPITERDAQYFQVFRYAQSAFDSLSAVCGVGLLTRDFGAAYTDVGRWVLVGLGLLGALLYLSAALVALRRAGAFLGVWRPAGVPSVVSMFVLFQVLVVVAVGVVLRLSDGAAFSPAQAVWTAVSSFASLGIAPGDHTISLTSTIVIAAWISALGWPVWFVAVPRLFKAHVHARHALVVAGGYTAFLLAAGGLMFLFEMPRGGGNAAVPVARVATSQESGVDNRLPVALSEAPAGERLRRCMFQAISAAGSGIPTENLREQQVSEGTKATLSAVMLVGGTGFSACGGAMWVLWLWAFLGIGGVGQGGRDSPETSRWCAAGLTCVGGMVLLAVVCATGLLLFESLAASRYTHAPTLADALLDACSIVGGGNLTTGLTDAVTSRNLTSGIRLNVDLYPIGMGWVMLMMLLGRAFPLAVLGRMQPNRRD